MDRGSGPPPSRTTESLALELTAALAGDVGSRRALMIKLMPVVQARVARILVRTRPASGVAPRQELSDVMQEVFVALFEDDARVLRAWNAERGLSLANFVGLVAERQTVSILRSGRRSPFRETPSEMEDLERALPHAISAEAGFLSRDMLVRLIERLRETLSPKGLDLFYRLYVDDEAVEVIARDTGLSADALYAWRSRLAKQVRALAAELAPESGSMSGAAPPPRTP